MAGLRRVRASVAVRSCRWCRDIGFLLRMWLMSPLSRRTLSIRDHFPDSGCSSSPDGSLVGVCKVGVIRHWDVSVPVDIEGHHCGFVGACTAFPVAAG